MNDKQISGVLVGFSFGCVAASKRDPAITSEVIKDKGASEDAGSWSNKLFPASTCQSKNTFTELRRHLGAMRAWHYANTYIWEDEIWRLLPEKRIEAYRQVVETDGKARATELLEAFIQDLPNLIDLARLARGTAFHESDYPTEPQVRAMFKYSVSYRPLPSSAGLNPVLFAEAVKELNELHQRRLAEANETLIKRFMAPLQTLSEQLKDPTRRKIGQVLSTIREFTETVPSMDLSGNTELVQMANQINAVFADITPQALREDERVRKMLGESISSAIGSLERFGNYGRKFA